MKKCNKGELQQIAFNIHLIQIEYDGFIKIYRKRTNEVDDIPFSSGNPLRENLIEKLLYYNHQKLSMAIDKRIKDEKFNIM